MPRRPNIVAPPPQPIRLLTGVPICDGHDSAINTINLEFIRHGIEVIYLGYHRSARDIARAAIQEDVRAIGLSSYNGGHVEFFAEVAELLRDGGASDIGLFGGGGGTITPDDAVEMKKRGVDRVFFPGTPLNDIVAFVDAAYGKAPAAPKRGESKPRVLRNAAFAGDRALARALSDVENGTNVRGGGTTRGDKPSRRPFVIGITGPGGAGKTTLIDELVLRFLASAPDARIAILSHDPSIVGNGALLGDRATMIYSQDDRVFMRSLASRGQAGGLAPATERCLRFLCQRRSDRNARDPAFDVILVETVGIGQEAMPFAQGLVDQTVLVMSPDYGSRLQLQKIVMLDGADVVVVNKSDRPGARTASSEIEQRIAINRRRQRVIGTTAKRHRDTGVDTLFAALQAARTARAKEHA